MACQASVLPGVYDPLARLLESGLMALVASAARIGVVCFKRLDQVKEAAPWWEIRLKDRRAI